MVGEFLQGREVFVLCMRGGEGSLADMMDVRERLSQAQASGSQRLSSVDYLVGCSYGTGEDLAPNTVV